MPLFKDIVLVHKIFIKRSKSNQLMAITQTRSNRKFTGGKLTDYRKKRVFELGSMPVKTDIGITKRVINRGRGGFKKQKLLRTDVVNLMGKDGKCKIAKIKTVIKNPANQNFSRRNIMTKGTIIDTDAGQAVVTSRPGQTGTLSAKLLWFSVPTPKYSQNRNV